MTSKQIIVIAFLILSSPKFFGQIRNRLNSNDLDRYGLNGKVYELEYREYTPILATDSSLSYKLNFEAFIKSHYDIQFNKNGYLTSKKEYFSKDDMLIKDRDWSYEYENKKLIKEVKIAAQRQDTSVWNYRYPSKDTVIITSHETYYGDFFYRYVQANSKEVLSTRAKSTQYRKYNVFYYDKNNRMVKSEEFAQDTIYSIKIYEYQDLKSKNITFEKYISKGIPLFVQSRKFDKENNVVAVFNQNNELYESFVYVYDKKKNWIERKTFNRSGKFIKLSKRKITYY
nr:hypothetical protein [uncultured Flavobacterium sp.]